jgi:DNA-binding transcriptional regulator YdaS (Cro superfamily)
MRNTPGLPADDPRVIACKRAIASAGGPSRVARIFKITPSAVHQWQIVSAPRCEMMEAISGISIYELRPDIFVRRKERKAG